MIPSNHSILIKKLEKYGIRGLPLQLLASHQTNRQQYTLINQYTVNPIQEMLFAVFL